MIQRILTENSMYEVDRDNGLVRRVLGMNPTTEYIGTEGVWRPYHSAEIVGDLLVIIWGYNPDKGALETTITSPVQETYTVESTPGQVV